MSIQRRFAALIAVGIVVSTACEDAWSQAVWSGGDGNWASDNWSGGTGPGGQPGGGQDVTLPLAAGVITLDSDLTTTVGSFNNLSQQSGTLVIQPGGRASFSGGIRLADGVDTFGELLLAGDLAVDGGLDVGYGQGDGTGNATGLLAIEGAASLTVGGNLDTWWDPGSHLSITGGEAEIVVNGSFLLGPDAALSANINSNTFSTIKALTDVNFPGGQGTLNVNFSDGYFPAVGTSWRLFDTALIGGQIPVVNVPETPAGTLLSVNYGEGGDLGQVVTLDYTNTLNLRIDPTTGEARIENPAAGASPLEIDGYLVRSDSGSLNLAGFTDLGEAGWLPGLPPSQSNGLLSETNLNGSLIVAPGASFSLGPIFQTAGTNDLAFEFRLASGGTLAGTVQLGADATGDFNGNGILDTGDVDDLTTQSAGGTNPAEYDLNADALVNADDVGVWIRDLFSTWIGDANLDGQFTSSDLVNVLASGTYEANVAAVWSTGDFNGDGRTTSSDLVAALADGGYEAGPRAAAAAVPEPTSVVLLIGAWLFIGLAHRR
jgi:hypothetical protein